MISAEGAVAALASHDRKELKLSNFESIRLMAA